MKKLLLPLAMLYGVTRQQSFDDEYPETSLAEFDFGLKLERSIFAVMDRWVEKNKQLYHMVVAPLVNVLIQTFLGKFSCQLHEFVNCNQCKKLVEFMSRSPYDDLLIEALAMTQMNACKTFFSE